MTYACTMSLMGVKYVLSMELLSGQHRVTFGMGMLVTYALGIVAFPFLCYWLRDSFKVTTPMSQNSKGLCIDFVVVVAFFRSRSPWPWPTPPFCYWSLSFPRALDGLWDMEGTSTLFC